MPTRKFAQDISEQIERINDLPLSDEQKLEIELWNQGRALQQIVGSYGWDVVEEIQQQMMQHEIETLLNMDPAERENVVAQHAVAHSAVGFVREFKRRIQAALDQSMPEVMRQQIRTPVPPELM